MKFIINERAMIPTYATEMTAAVLLGALIITNNCYCFVVIIHVVHFIYYINFFNEVKILYIHIHIWFINI